MATSSADPDRLAEYAAGTGEGREQLARRAAELSELIGAFNRADKELGHNLDDLGAALAALVERMGELDGFVGEVGEAFAAVDRSSWGVRPSGAPVWAGQAFVEERLVAGRRGPAGGLLVDGLWPFAPGMTVRERAHLVGAHSQEALLRSMSEYHRYASTRRVRYEPGRWERSPVQRVEGYWRDGGRTWVRPYVRRDPHRRWVPAREVADHAGRARDVRYARYFSRGGHVLSVGHALVEQHLDDRHNPDLSDRQRTARLAETGLAVGIGSGGGGWAGSKAGALAGAKIGGIVGSAIPGAGTMAGVGVGAAVGAVVGGVVGSGIGTAAGKKGRSLWRSWTGRDDG